MRGQQHVEACAAHRDRAHAPTHAPVRAMRAGFGVITPSVRTACGGGREVPGWAHFSTARLRFGMAAGGVPPSVPVLSLAAKVTSRGRRQPRKRRPGGGA